VFSPIAKADPEKQKYLQVLCKINSGMEQMTEVISIPDFNYHYK
jgi:hypothetical protein